MVIVTWCFVAMGGFARWFRLLWFWAGLVFSGFLFGLVALWCFVVWVVSRFVVVKL